MAVCDWLRPPKPLDRLTVEPSKSVYFVGWPEPWELKVQ